MPIDAEGGGSSGAEAGTSGTGRVQEVVGEVAVVRENGALDSLDPAASVGAGDFICALNGEVAIAFGDGTRLRIGDQGQVFLREIAYDETGRPDFYSMQAAGGAFALFPGTDAAGRSTEIVVDTPVASLRPVGAGLEAHHSPAQGLSVQMQLMGEGDSEDGFVLVENAFGRAELTDDGHAIRVAQAGDAPVLEAVEAGQPHGGPDEGGHAHLGDMEVSPGGAEDALVGDLAVVTGTPGVFHLTATPAPLADPSFGDVLTGGASTPGLPRHDTQLGGPIYVEYDPGFPETVHTQTQAAAAGSGRTRKVLVGWEPLGATWEVEDDAKTIGPTPQDTFHGKGALISPREGASMAEIKAGQDGLSNVYELLGIKPEILPNMGVKDASFIWTTLNLKAGSELSFDWLLDSANQPNSLDGTNQARQDFALFGIVGQAIADPLFLLSNTGSSGTWNTDAGATGWRTFVYTVPADGTYTIGFGAVRNEITDESSRLFVDNVRINRALDGSFVRIDDGSDPHVRMLAQGAVVADDVLVAHAGSTTTVSAAALLANDVDPDTSNAIRIVATDNSLGHVTLTGDGYVTYDPGTRFAGLAEGEIATDSFRYEVDAGNGLTTWGTVAVTVTGVNDAPVAKAGTFAVSAGGSAPIDVLAWANDVDSDDDRTTLRVVEAHAANGGLVSVTGRPGEGVSYDPSAAFRGLAEGQTATDTITYTVEDRHGAAVTGTLAVTVTGVNDGPTALSDYASAAADAAIMLNPLANDDDVDSDDDRSTLRIVAAEAASGAPVSFDRQPGAGLSYDASGPFRGLSEGETATDTITYTVEDRHGARSTATVSITVTGVNDAPTVGADAAAARADASAVAIDVLANDHDVDSDDGRGTLRIVAAEAASGAGVSFDHAPGGKLAYDAAGRFAYLAAGETATDTITYTIEDGHGARSTGTVLVTVTGANDRPLAVGDSALTEGAPISLSVLANDSDPDRTDQLRIIAVEGQSVGDGQGVVLASGAGVALHGDTLAYAPGSAFDGLSEGEKASETFRYTVGDGHGGTSEASVTVAITGRNDAPAAAVDVAAAGAGGAAVAIDVLGNDDDVDSDDSSSTLRIVEASADSGATVTFSKTPGEGLTYDAAGRFGYLGEGETATDVVTYMIEDRHGARTTGTVQVTVTGVNDRPVANSDGEVPGGVGDNPLITAANTVLRAPGSAGLLANDHDPDRSDTLTLAAIDGDAAAVGRPITLASGALLIADADGSYVYDPNGRFAALAEGETGFDSFEYTVTDGHGATATATAYLKVYGLNDAPVASDDQAVTDQDSAVRIAAINNDSDPDAGGNLRILSETIDTSGTRGTVRLNADGTLTYDPSGHFDDLRPGETATDTFRYDVDDFAGARSTATVTVTITGVERSPSATRELIDSFETDGALAQSWNATPLTMNNGGATVVEACTDGSCAAAASHGAKMIQLQGSGASIIDIEALLSNVTLANGGAVAPIVFPNDVVDNSRPISGAAMTYSLWLPTADVADGRLALSFDWSFLAGKADPVASHLNDYAAFTITDGTTVHVVKLDDALALKTGASEGGWHTSQLNLQALFPSSSGSEQVTIGFAVLNDGADYDPSRLLVDNIRIVQPEALPVQAGAEQVITISPDVLLAGVAASGGSHTGVLRIAGIDASATFGQVSQTADGGIRYDPGERLAFLAEGQAWVDTVEYKVVDAFGFVRDAELSIQVTGVNDPPIAHDDDRIGTEAIGASADGAPIDIQVLLNDTDPDVGDLAQLRIVAAQAASGAVVTFSGVPSSGISYDPSSTRAFESLAAGETAADRITYTIEDSHGARATANAWVTVIGINDVPVAAADGAVTDQNTTIALSVLANDRDPDASDHLSVMSIDTSRTLGHAAMSPDGTVHYDAGAAFAWLGDGETAADSFRYTVSDGHGGTSEAEVSLTVRGLNDAPVAGLDVLPMDASGRLSVAAGTLLANDLDPDRGDALHITGIDASGSVGSVSFDGSAVTYDPGHRFLSLREGDTAVDTFTYQAADAHGAAGTGEVHVLVRGENDAPLAVADFGTTAEDRPVTLQLLANDSDPDAGEVPSIISIGDSHTRGLVTLNQDGSVTYDPNGQFNSLNFGQTAYDSFTYRVSDGHGGFADATATVAVDGRSSTERIVDSFEAPFDPLGRTGSYVTTVGQYQEPDGAHRAYAPTDGQGLARLEAFGAAAQPVGQSIVSALEEFLGIPGHSLPSDPIDGTKPANGSAFKLSVHVEAGDRLSFDWMFDARDFVNAPPDGKKDDDFAVFTVVGGGSAPELFKLSDVRATGDQGATGWRSSVYTAAKSADLTIGLAVVNDRVSDPDALQHSYLLVDNVRVNRDFSEGYQVVDQQANSRFETLVHV